MTTNYNNCGYSYRYIPPDGTLHGMHEPTFMVLTALAAGPAHGYGIIREVSTLSDGAVNLRASTLYAALDRLTGDGMVEIDREEAVAGRLRRYYRLTNKGSAALAMAAAQRQRSAAAALERLRQIGVRYA